MELKSKEVALGLGSASQDFMLKFQGKCVSAGCVCSGKGRNADFVISVLGVRGQAMTSALGHAAASRIFNLGLGSFGYRRLHGP